MSRPSDDHDQSTGSQPSPSARRSAVCVPDPHLGTLDDDRFLVELLARLTQQPAAQTRARWQTELRSLGTNVRQAMEDWQLPFYEWSDRLIQFYEQTDAFLFETLSWNLCGTKCQMRKWLAEFLGRVQPEGGRVLCYGDGLGCDSSYLAQAGHDVVYYEVSEQCQEFAAALFAKENARVTASRSLDDFSDGSFDAVVCLDVLEHVPDPPALVDRLSRLIRKGGHLIVHAPFFFLTPSVGTHLRSNRRYSGDWRRLYGASGLRPVAGEFFWNPLALRKGDEGESPAAFPWVPRIGGWLLSVGRWWHFPHVFVAQRLLGGGDRRTLAARAARLDGA